MGLYGDFSDRYLEHENRNENKSKRLTLPPCFIRGMFVASHRESRTKTRQNRAEMARNARIIP